MSEEHIVFEGKVPFRVVHFSHNILWLILLGWNIGLLISWLQCFGEGIKISTQRVVLSRGMFSKDIEEVEFYRVKDTKYQQTLFQRVLDVGTITLFSDDATAPTLSFVIEQPEFYREQIRESIHTARQHMGAIQLD